MNNPRFVSQLSKIPNAGVYLGEQAIIATPKLFFIGQILASRVLPVIPAKNRG